MSIKNQSNEIKIIRIYEAALITVWEAWTNPNKAAHWWGPRGFTITNHSKELKVGGIWHYTMHGPDGINYPNKTKYLEVEKYSRLVYDHGGNDDQAPMFRVTVNFTEENNNTKMDMTMTLPTPEAAEQTKIFIKKAGGNTTWDRLAEYLAQETSGKEKFVINRTFNSDIKTMFEVWTNPKHLSQWLSPTGTQMKFFRAEIKPGGSAFYMMSGAEGFKIYGKTKYLEIKTPNRIVYTQQFCDENEKISRHPMAPSWPETMNTMIEFNEEEANQTRVTTTWEPLPPTTTEELTTFVNARAGMSQGWTGSFDKLEEYLTSILP